jgi:hypothetical protein
MKTYRGVNVYKGVSGQLYPRERVADTHWLGGWVDFRARLDDMEEF